MRRIITVSDILQKKKQNLTNINNRRITPVYGEAEKTVKRRAKTVSIIEESRKN